MNHAISPGKNIDFIPLTTDFTGARFRVNGITSFFSLGNYRQLSATIGNHQQNHGVAKAGGSSKSHPAAAGSKEIPNPKLQKRGRI
jgi:hypothetical protein